MVLNYHKLFCYSRKGTVLVRDSKFSQWIYVVKSVSRTRERRGWRKGGEVERKRERERERER